MLKKLQWVYLLDIKLENLQITAISIYHNGCGKRAWLSFAEVELKFFGSIKNSDYQNILENMLACFEALDCRTSLKVDFLHCTLGLFPTKLG